MLSQLQQAAEAGDEAAKAYLDKYEEAQVKTRTYEQISAATSRAQKKRDAADDRLKGIFKELEEATRAFEEAETDLAEALEEERIAYS